MSKHEVQIEAITEADIPAAVRTIQDAFADDPFAAWVYDTARFSKIRNNVSLGLRMQWGIRNGKIFVAHTPERRCAGVAMWCGPRELAKKQTWGEWWEEWKLWFNQLRMNLWYGRGGLNAKRYWLWKSAQNAMQKQLWTDPAGYWFLNILTIHPDSQGRGIGKALVEKVSKRADAEGTRCYLESSKFEPHVKIYERMGFKFVKEIECKDEDASCKLFAMIREPNRNASNLTQSFTPVSGSTL